MKVLVLSLLMVCLIGQAFASQKPNKSTSGGTIEAEVMKLLDDYMNGWNSKDVAAWERTFHFPHYRLASGQMTVLDRPGMQDPARIWTRVGSDWHHSKWDRRRIVHASADKVHADTKFTRYRADNSVIGSYESLYIVTKENGRWGVKMRSSFAQ